jgi:hypothetical protein
MMISIERNVVLPQRGVVRAASGGARLGNGRAGKPILNLNEVSQDRQQPQDIHQRHLPFVNPRYPPLGQIVIMSS